MMIIPWLLILLGGIAIWAGISGTNPLEVIKSVLSGEGVPKKNG